MEKFTFNNEKYEINYQIQSLPAHLTENKELEDTLLLHNPAYCSTVQLQVNYNKEAQCPTFMKFLEESMEGDMKQVPLIQEMLGYFLVPITSAQKCFVIVGATKTRNTAEGFE